MTTRVIAGKTLDFDEEGFMTDPNAWEPAIAEELAHEIGIDLAPEHWKVIEFTRADFAKSGDVPTLRRITAESGVNTKDLYALFPKKPAKKVAFVAGLHKPSGCL